MKHNRAIDSYISYYLEPHEVKTSEKYSYLMFWVKDGEAIAEIENPNFWLRSDIWESISKMFNLNYVETESVIKIWLGKHYNLGRLTPRCD